MAPCSHKISQNSARPVADNSFLLQGGPLKASSLNTGHSFRLRDELEDRPFIRTLAEELSQIGEQLYGATETSLRTSGQDECDGLVDVSFSVTEALSSDQDSRFGDLSQPAPSCDDSFVDDGRLSDDECGHFSSESFFCEEDPGASSFTFDPDLLDDALHDPIPSGSSDLAGTTRAPETNEDASMTPNVPVKLVWICEHVFKAPTLRHRRLAYLRQLHVLLELGRTDAFDVARPIECPVLHTPPKAAGLARVAEQGVIGGWADVDRPEPRYITHFRGRPELLFAEQRAVLNGAVERTVLMVDQMRQHVRVAA